MHPPPGRWMMGAPLSVAFNKAVSSQGNGFQVLKRTTSRGLGNWTTESGWVDLKLSVKNGE